MESLGVRVALVSGASRGVGRGVAAVLHDAGCTVYASGRTVAGAVLPPGVIRVNCDHTDDAWAANPELLRRRGAVLVTAALALEYGFADVDGRQPPPLTMADV